jgi:hypothetical protein
MSFSLSEKGASAAHNEATVYTALTKGYDKRPMSISDEPKVLTEVRIAPDEIKEGREGVLWNREQKILHPPKTGLWSLYLDASFSPKGPVRDSVETWLEKHDAAMFKHPSRTCAYDEIDECVKQGKLTAVEGEKARSTMMLAGFPRHFGLWACGVIARRVHCNALQIFTAPLWWQFTKDLPRDQIWLPFVLWKIKDSPKRIYTIDKDIYSNKLLSFRRHGS